MSLTSLFLSPPPSHSEKQWKIYPHFDIFDPPSKQTNNNR